MESESLVVNLLQVKAPKVLVGIVLLLMWSENIDIQPRFHLLDLFAGGAAATKVWNAHGYTCASIDEMYCKGERTMDFLSPAGWLLAVWAILCEHPEALNLMGPECGSWGVPARGTSMQNFINIFGALHLAFVSNAEMTVSRIVLLGYLILAKHGHFVLEQPAGSLLKKHRRWEKFANETAYVYEIRFWMMLLGASSPKPTDVYSNGSWISGLNIGPLTKDFKQKNSKLQTTRRYVNKDGVLKFTGTSGLKLSACYPEGFAKRLLQCWEGRRALPGHLRHKHYVDTSLTDRELFAKMPFTDAWVDASMCEVWKYLYHCKHVVIPNSWVDTMATFDKEITDHVCVPDDQLQEYNKACTNSV